MRSGVIAQKISRYVLLLGSVLSGCATDFYVNNKGQLIPREKHLVGAGSAIYFTATNAGTIYLVAGDNSGRRVFLSRTVEEGDDMSVNLEDARIQKALSQASLDNTRVLEMYFIPNKEKTPIDAKK
jgi:hypothetical protein